MDAHTAYASDYIRQCFAVLHETGADNVGGPWIAEGKGFIGQAIAAAFQSAFAVGGALGHRSDYEGTLDTVYLGCWPVEVFERIGLFDEEMVRSEDDEFNLRLTRAGGKIWQSPRIKSWYHPRESLGSLLCQQIQYGYWKVRVIQKHKIPCFHPASCSRVFCPVVDFSRRSFSMVASCSLGLDRIGGNLFTVQPCCLRSNGSAHGLETLSFASDCVCLLPFRVWVWISARNFGFRSFETSAGSRLHKAYSRFRW